MEFDANTPGSNTAIPEIFSASLFSESSPYLKLKNKEMLCCYVFSSLEGHPIRK